MRIGHGYDVHRFAEGDFITLGGVRIAHHHGLLAHSDGDVVLHALSDALLGAAALGISVNTFRTPIPPSRARTVACCCGMWSA